MADTRKYHIKHIDPATQQVVRERIIEATNRSAARNHATNTTIAVDLLTTDEAIRLTREGVQEEVATLGTTEKGVHPDQSSLLGGAVGATNAATESQLDAVDQAVADLTSP